MQTYSRVALAVIVLAATPRVAAAQSLADVARQQEENRSKHSAVRTFTNADLSTTSPAKDAPSTTEPAAPAAAPAKSEPATTFEEIPGTGTLNMIVRKADEKPNEDAWRRSARDLRGRLAKAQADVAAAESELAALRPGDDQETRQATTATLTRRRNDVRLLSEELTRFVLRAQTSTIPPEWIR